MLLQDVSEIRTPKVGSDREHVYHLYVVECDDRDGLRAGSIAEFHHVLRTHALAAVDYLTAAGS